MDKLDVETWRRILYELLGEQAGVSSRAVAGDELHAVFVIPPKYSVAKALADALRKSSIHADCISDPDGNCEVLVIW